MVQVNYYETATMRKTGKMKDGEIKGTFFVNISPEEIPEVPEIDPTLKGEEKERALKLREIAVKRREVNVEQVLINTKFIACDMVRALTGSEGVLVASIIKEDK